MRNAYTAYFEEDTLASSPLRLVCLMYEKAISELRKARTHLAAGQVPERCAAVSKACDVIAELMSSLDLERGGDTAARLEEIYRYSISRLLQAGLQKEDSLIVEVLGLLTTLQEGWVKIAAQESDPAPMMPHPAVYGSGTGEFASQSWSF